MKPHLKRFPAAANVDGWLCFVVVPGESRRDPDPSVERVAGAGRTMFDAFEAWLDNHAFMYQPQTGRRESLRAH